MGLDRALRRLAECVPPLAAGFLHVLSAVSLVVLCKFVMETLSFPYAATLTALHHAVIALCLWFWTLFGLFQPRQLPIYAIMLLAAASAFSTMLAMLSLRHNSLSVYQATRLCTPPTSFVFQLMRTPQRYKQNLKAAQRQLSCLAASICTVFAGAVLLAIYDPVFTRAGALFAAASFMTGAAHQVWSLPLRESTHGNELQLQLYTKSTGALLILPFVPIFDDYSITSASSIRHFEFDQARTTLIFGTALLAFLSFIAMRTSISRSSNAFYSALLQLTSIVIFFADRVVFATENHHGNVRNFCVALVMIGSFTFAVYRDEVLERIYEYLPMESRDTSGICQESEKSHLMYSSSIRTRENHPMLEDLQHPDQALQRRPSTASVVTAARNSISVGSVQSDQTRLNRVEAAALATCATAAALDQIS